MPPLLVRLRPPLPGVGVLPLLAEGEAAGEDHGDGPLPGPGHHRLYRPQHALHGHGALSHDRRVQRHAQHRKPGKSEGRAGGWTDGEMNEWVDGLASNGGKAVRPEH